MSQLAKLTGCTVYQRVDADLTVILPDMQVETLHAEPHQTELITLEKTHCKHM